MASTRRKQRGAYYTPAPVARHILALTLNPLLDKARCGGSDLPRVLDPACGDGVFLAEAAELLAAASGQTTSVRQRAHLVRTCIFGIDIDEQAVAEARLRLAAWIWDEPSQRGNAGPDRQQIKQLLERNIVRGNALLDADDAAARRLDSPAPAVDLAGRFGFDRFDAVVGNPPYINIRLASQTLAPSLREYYANRYQTARGAYDLYVLFLERGCQLLRGGGRFGWIVPNKLAGAEYGAACRALLTETNTLDYWQDLSAVRVFAEAGVYPHIIVGCHQAAAPDHAIQMVRWPIGTQLDHLSREHRQRPMTIPLGSLDTTRWAFDLTLDVEHRIATVPLGRLARLHSGATGFQAQQLAAELTEGDGADQSADSFAFITSGNIDRYQICDRSVRFMKRRFEQARLPRDCPLLSENKQRLYGSPKLVVAGMTRQLEAAYDQQGRALGVQVYAAIDFQCDPYYLLGLLNSRLMSHLFRQRFSAKQLAGGYLAINKAQLVQLPIVEPLGAGAQGRRIAQLARQLEQAHQTPSAKSAASRALLESMLDQCVYALYRLTEEEILAADDALGKAA